MLCLLCVIFKVGVTCVGNDYLKNHEFLLGYIMREKIKDMYLNQIPIDDICTTLNISRGTFYYHKKEDLKKGANWDILLLENKRDIEDIKDKEAIFLKTLIESFEKFIQKSEELEPESIEKLHKYATTYWRLKAPKGDDEFALRQRNKKLIEKTLQIIGNLALTCENTEVVVFLSENAEEIIRLVFKEV